MDFKTQGDKMDELEYGLPSMDMDEEFSLMNQSNADFEHWSGALFWSFEDLVALLLGKDPRIVTWDMVRKHVNQYYKIPLCEEYARLRALVLRDLKTKELKRYEPPINYLSWALLNNLECSPVLLDAVIKRFKKYTNETDEQVLRNPENLKKLGIAKEEHVRKQMERIEASMADTKSDSYEFIHMERLEIEELKKQMETLQKHIIELESLQWSGFDDSQDTYTEELAIAVRAHTAVSQNWQQGSSVKNQITAWLKQNHPKLSNEAKERIAKVCNWQKLGGAPVTPT